MTTILRPAALALCAALVAAPAQALDLGAMSDDERAAFRAEVRAYLLDNPEVLMEAIGVLEAREAAAQADAEAEALAALQGEIYDDGFSWVGGNPDGDVTLVEFMDYRCGYCKRAFTEVEQLVATDGNIRFILKEFPILGEQSTLAAQFAIATRQLHGSEAYKQVHDVLMSMRGDVSAAALERIAGESGLDAGPILERMNAPEVAAEIAQTRALAQALQISGTPTFILGGEMVRGYLPLEAMEAVVAEVRADG